MAQIRVQIDHGGPDALVAHQLLDRSDVGAGSEHVGCERVPKRVARDGLGDSRPSGGRLDRPLQGRGMEMISLSANVRETRRTQGIRVGRRQRNQKCWDYENE